MTTVYRYVLVVALLVAVGSANALAATKADDLPAPSATGSGWNKTDGALFGSLTRMSRAELDARLVYSSGEIGFPLLQSLYYDPKCDCYTLTITLRDTATAQIAHFWRAPRGFYRTANGPYLELEELDSLKAVTELNGTRLLFAEVGLGDWRCVSIHESSGNYLLIDYRADGLIERLRDSQARIVLPRYSNGRVVALTQTWNSTTGPQTRTTVVTD